MLSHVWLKTLWKQEKASHRIQFKTLTWHILPFWTHRIVSPPPPLHFFVCWSVFDKGRCAKCLVTWSVFSLEKSLFNKGGRGPNLGWTGGFQLFWGGWPKHRGEGRNVVQEYSGTYFWVAAVSYPRAFKNIFFLKKKKQQPWAVELFYIAVKT